MEPARPLETPAPAPAATPALPRMPMKKRPFFAGFLAFFPGLGNIYNGLYLRGVLFFTVVACLVTLGDEGESSTLGFVVAFVWLFNVIDSYRQAQLINYGYAQDLGLEDLPKLPKASQGGLLAGVLLLALGALASLQVFFDIEVGWVLRYWPLGILALGAWLVVAYFRERARASGPTDTDAP